MSNYTKCRVLFNTIEENTVCFLPYLGIIQNIQFCTVAPHPMRSVAHKARNCGQWNSTEHRSKDISGGCAYGKQGGRGLPQAQRAVPSHNVCEGARAIKIKKCLTNSQLCDMLIGDRGDVVERLITSVPLMSIACIRSQCAASSVHLLHERTLKGVLFFLASAPFRIILVAPPRGGTGGGGNIWENLSFPYT